MERRLFFSAMLIVILALGFVACDNSGNSGGNGDINVVGPWAGTVSVDGNTALMTILFNANGEFSITAIMNGNVVLDESGSYHVEGNDLMMLGQSVTVSNNRFTLLFPDGPNDTTMIPVTFTRRN